MPALLQNPQPFVQIDPSPVHLHQTLHRNAVALRMLGISERHPQLRPHLLLDHPRQRRVEAAIRLPFLSAQPNSVRSVSSFGIDRINVRYSPSDGYCGFLQQFCTPPTATLHSLGWPVKARQSKLSGPVTSSQSVSCVMNCAAWSSAAAFAKSVLAS